MTTTVDYKENEADNFVYKNMCTLEKYHPVYPIIAVMYLMHFINKLYFRESAVLCILTITEERKKLI